MDIFLSINNREQVIQLPIVPSSFQISSTNNHEVYKTVNQGDLNLVGDKGLETVTLSSFFPKQHYSFSRNTDYVGWEYVSLIESWIDRKVPIRLLITNTPINMPVLINNFDYGVQDGTGDIYYSLTLTRFKFINLEQKKVR